MDKYIYICHHCGKDYVPTRRGIQKYCSNSCRTRAFVVKNSKGLGLPIKSNSTVQEEKSEGMSWAGVGNTTAGVLAANLITKVFTSEENKPATKKDLKNLINLLKQRFHPINNIPLRNDGAKAYYDLETKNIVYLKSTQ